MGVHLKFLAAALVLVLSSFQSPAAFAGSFDAAVTISASSFSSTCTGLLSKVKARHRARVAKVSALFSRIKARHRARISDLIARVKSRHEARSADRQARRAKRHACYVYDTGNLLVMLSERETDVLNRVGRQRGMKPTTLAVRF